MKRAEYIKTIIVNGNMINVGIDDYGQTYFLEYLDENGNLVENCVGSYETDYMNYVEMLFPETDNDASKSQLYLTQEDFNKLVEFSKQSQTNGDYIRSLNNEELADIMFNGLFWCKPKNDCDDNCVNCITQWLESEHKE